MGTIKNHKDVENFEDKEVPIQLITTQESSLQTQTHSQFQPQTHGLDNSNSTVDGHIRFGSYIVLQHNSTLRYLSSGSLDSDESPAEGNKDQVSATRRKSENEFWMVLIAYGERRRLKTGDAVPYSTQIRLRHVVSRSNLHSHPDYVSPISKQQDVICHGDENNSDLNDNWLVQRYSYTNNYDNSGYWMASDVITIRHIQTGATLHSHRMMLDDINQEVTCYGPGHEENDKWRAEHIKDTS